MMLPPTGVTCAMALLAQRQVADIGSRFRHDGHPMAWGQLIAIGAVLVIAIVAVVSIAWLLHLKERRGFRNSGQLFRELARVHKLTHRERQFVKRLARLHKLPAAADVFLRPDCFEDPKGGATDPMRLDLRRRLFSLADPSPAKA